MEPNIMLKLNANFSESNVLCSKTHPKATYLVYTVVDYLDEKKKKKIGYKIFIAVIII